MFLRPTSRDYTDAYKMGASTPLEIAERTLGCIEESETGKDQLSAFIEVRKDDIIEQAKASSARYAAGQPIGPLDGVPIPIKDEFDVQGYRTRVGTSFKGGRAASEDSVVARRLREQGAILFGKTHMTELGLGGVGTNPNHRAPRNPHDPTRITGGSSSGSAAAVAAGIAPLALGSDAGGSIRMPAALCGVYGMKPTYGKIPTTGGSLLSWSLDHLGPLGSSVDDLALFVDATAGPNAQDEASMFGPEARKQGQLRIPSLKGLKFAWCPEYADDAEESVRRSFHEALARLREHGATIERVDLQWVREIMKVGYVTFTVEAAAGQRDWLKTHRDQYNLDTRMVLAIGENVSAVEYLNAQRIRTLIRREFGDICSRYDAFLNPTLACTAVKVDPVAEKYGQVDTKLNSLIARYTFAGTLTGFPAINIPCGTDSKGLPIGLHMMARPWHDERLLRVAAAADQVMPSMPQPKVFFDLFS